MGFMLLDLWFSVLFYIHLGVSVFVFILLAIVFSALL